MKSIQIAIKNMSKLFILKSIFTFGATSNGCSFTYIQIIQAKKKEFEKIKGDKEKKNRRKKLGGKKIRRKKIRKKGGKNLAKKKNGKKLSEKVDRFEIKDETYDW